MDASTFGTSLVSDRPIDSIDRLDIVHDMSRLSAVTRMPPSISGTLRSLIPAPGIAVLIAEYGSPREKLLIDVRQDSSMIKLAYAIDGPPLRKWGGGDRRGFVQKSLELCLISPSSPYRFERYPSESANKSITLMLRPERVISALGDEVERLSPEWAALLLEPHGEPYAQVRPFGLRSLRILREIDDSPLHGAIQRLYLEGKILELMAYAMDSGVGTVRDSANTLRRKDISRMKEAAEVLEIRMQDPPSLTELASMLGVSLSKLKRDFKLTHGIGAYEYLLDRRFDVARNLLKAGELSVKEAAYRVGYRSSSYFTRAFKKRYGLTPDQSLTH